MNVTKEIIQRKEIPTAMDALEKEIAALEEEVGVLASMIVAVTSPEVPQLEAKSGEPVKDYGCELASNLRDLSKRICAIVARVKDLHERVEL